MNREPLLRVTIGAFLVLAQPLAPATITVSAGCTLVNAINAANTDSAVGLCPAGSGTDEIILTQDVELTSFDNEFDGKTGLPVVTSEITIQGGGKTIARSSAPGTPDFRIFIVGDSPLGDLVLNDVTVTNGSITDPLAEGGGIFNTGNLTLTNSTVSGNIANGVGGSAYGGGIYNTGYYGFGVLEITNSTISNNAALGSSSGYALGGGLLSFDGVLTSSNSTVSDNIASGNLVYGAGIYSNDSGSIEDSTISSNANYSTTYDAGSGIRISGASFTIANATIAGNSGTYAYSAGISPSGTITFTATIIADNTPLNCDAAPTDGGSNFSDVGDIECGFGALTGLDSSLADNGGPTMTHALLAGSAAIDAAGSCATPADQRGASRSGDCDSGAFEFIPCPDLVLSDEMILGSETRENCQNIFVGPLFDVTSTGDLTLGVGKSVALGDGTSVASGGQLTIFIDPDLQLAPPPP